ncbi:MAG: AgmX/PglI C-terminal domain-containing protein [Kofleriaceae bacterium]
MIDLTKLASITVLVVACGGAGMGADTRADVTKQMQSAQPTIQGCYADALKHNRKLRGMVSLEFIAEPGTGQFKNILIRRDELNDPTVRQCILDEVGKLKLDKPTKSAVSIPYPIRFAPTN